MASSDVEIANAALTLLGESAIMSLDDESDTARAVKRVYTLTLEAALRDHNWNFAILRTGLARHAAAPEFDFDHMYVLPTDPYCLRVIETSLDKDEAYRIETYKSGQEQSRVLVTDSCSVKIVYVARLTDPVLWDSLFADAFVFELAYRLTYALTAHDAARQTLALQKELAWRKARARDGQEGRALKKLTSSSFTSVR
ncbi:MAG: hypothetical protein HYV99_01315 [Betaproteobacteria bacterium]|nr:hypothetical protein [Betaproteobacteria bacterium]